VKTKKDILFLCQYFYPEYISSATLPYDVALALVKAGFSISVLCGYPKEYNHHGEVPLDETREGIEIHRVKYLQSHRGNFAGRLINYFSFTLAILARLPSFRDYKAVIVYSTPPILPLLASWASQLFGVKMVFVCYDVYPEIAYMTGSIDRAGFIGKIMHFINKSVYRRAIRVVALSSEMKDYLTRHRDLHGSGQVVVIPNWYKESGILETSKSYLNEKFAGLNPMDNFVVSYFGNMGVCQDLETVLGAIRRLRCDCGVKFLFAGHGSKLDQLRMVIQMERLTNVIVYDFLHGEDFHDAMVISGAFLVSMHKQLVGLAVPSKTYSYMNAGKPVIAIMDTETDIARDLLANRAGYVVEVGAVDRLVEAIIEMRDNVPLRHEFGRNIRQIFLSKFTTDRCTAQYVEMMKEVLGGS